MSGSPPTCHVHVSIHHSGMLIAEEVALIEGAERSGGVRPFSDKIEIGTFRRVQNIRVDVHELGIEKSGPHIRGRLTVRCFHKI